ncbi:hypothetical protein INN71_13545 [Nocardioides sp. ChNu-153]|uniref:hypothetical protein n=1 Tax=unclassified Nocardioides TaxID=2615069 RepID=UPI002404BA00|nr:MULTISPECIES: hypothetical protein [unclassified Nocardioides]MDF9717367.1 hypothetical protein [Nocardioides sp. ChNu-99]MDN7122410.1 hypothetical protein [Nocardioides sp. ChNu-153]
MSSYRSYLTFDPRPDAVDLALQQIAAWLREKSYGEPDLQVSQLLRVSNSAELVVAHHEAKRVSDFRIRLTETERNGTQWLTSVAMHSPARGTGWLSIRSGHTGGKQAERPKVAKYLIEVLELRDGDYPVSAGAQIVRPDDVEDLLEAVCDLNRNGLLFVAATDKSQADMLPAFAKRAETWARRIHGIAQFVVLDPEASTVFNEGVGPTHAAIPWTVRTYAPGVDPAWEPDARRHRVLGTRRLADETDQAIAGIITRAARKHSAGHKLPDAARTVIKGLNRVEDRLLLDALFSPGSPTAQLLSDASEGLAVAADKSTGTDLAPREAVAETGAVAETLASEAAQLLAHGPATNGASIEVDTETFEADYSREPDDSNITTPRDPRALNGISASTAHAANDGETRSVDSEGDIAAVAAEYLSIIELVKQTLGVDDLTPQALEQVAMSASRASDQAAAREQMAERISSELAERQGRIEALEEEVEAWRETAEEALLEQGSAEEDRRAIQDEVLRLRRFLLEQGRHTEALSPTPTSASTSAPRNFEELLDRLGEFEQHGVVFTGDRRRTIGLDDNDTVGNLVGAAWEYLLVLADYVRSKMLGHFDGNMKSYLLHTPAGYRPLPKSRFGEKESRSTLNQWGADRVFPVPPEVAPTGEILMEAHFKLPRCGMVTPRIHYYDNAHADGRVYVGYIGPHLRTKATN